MKITNLKRGICLLLCAILLCSLPVAALAAGSPEYLVNGDLVLNEKEQQALLSELKSAEREFGCKVALMVLDTVPQYSDWDSFIETAYFGMPHPKNAGDLLLITFIRLGSGMDGGKAFAVNAYGKARDVFPEESTSFAARMARHVILSNEMQDDYSGGFREFLSVLRMAVKAGDAFPKDFYVFLNQYYNGASVIDEIRILTDSQRRKLSDSLQRMSDAYGFDCRIVLVSTTPGDTARWNAKQYYTLNDIGVGKDRDGILFFINCSPNRALTVYAHGAAEQMITLEDAYSIQGADYKQLKNSEYYAVLSAAVERCETLLKQAKSRAESREINAKFNPGGVYSLGDLTGDGKINSSDARVALRAAAKLVELSEFAAQVGDIDGNGKVNSADARQILRAAAKLAELPDRRLTA